MQSKKTLANNLGNLLLPKKEVWGKYLPACELVFS